MPEWPGIIALMIQALVAAVTVEQLRRNVFPALNQLHAPSLITDVWAPLVLLLPMLFFLSRLRDGDVNGAAWVGVGGPIVCAVIGLGAALIVSRPSVPALPWASMAIWTGAGVVLLLLAAAHHLTLWMGQSAFALAAVLLWINTPDDAGSAEQMSSVQLRAGVGLVLALIAAVAHGTVSVFVPDKLIMISGALTVAAATMSMGAASRCAGPDVTIRIGGWSIAYGTLLALGVLSLLRLVPAAYSSAVHDVVIPVHRVARGFEEYWIESTIAMTFATAVVALMRMSAVFRRVIGLCLIAAAAILAAWRLSRT